MWGRKNEEQKEQQFGDLWSKSKGPADMSPEFQKERREWGRKIIVRNSVKSA